MDQACFYSGPEALVRTPLDGANAVRQVLAAENRPLLVAAWPNLAAFARAPHMAEALLAAQRRWSAGTRSSQAASRVQRDFCHQLLLHPGLLTSWEVALPLLARESLDWAQGCALTDYLLAIRRRLPAVTTLAMPLNYPRHVRAHAEPSPKTYHVFCPQCQQWVGGAWAHELAGAGAPRCAEIHCPHCQSTAPGRFQPDYVLPFGPYQGRAVTTLHLSPERDYLEFLLHSYCLAVAGAPQALRLAVLGQLGWLSPERRQRTPGPDLDRLEQELKQAAKKQAQRVAQEPRRPPGEAPGANDQPKAKTQWNQEFDDQYRAQQQRQYHRQQRQSSPRRGGATTQAWREELQLTGPLTYAGLRLAYRQLSKQHHPDVGGDAGRMQQVNHAREQALVWLEKHGEERG